MFWVSFGYALGKFLVCFGHLFLKKAAKRLNKRQCLYGPPNHFCRCSKLLFSHWESCFVRCRGIASGLTEKPSAFCYILVTFSRFFTSFYLYGCFVKHWLVLVKQKYLQIFFALFGYSNLQNSSKGSSGQLFSRWRSTVF